MASSQSSHSNSVTDISHVLESLGSLIGELDAIEIDTVGQSSSLYADVKTGILIRSCPVIPDNPEVTRTKNNSKSRLWTRKLYSTTISFQNFHTMLSNNRYNSVLVPVPEF